VLLWVLLAVGGIIVVGCGGVVVLGILFWLWTAPASSPQPQVDVVEILEDAGLDAKQREGRDAPAGDDAKPIAEPKAASAPRAVGPRVAPAEKLPVAGTGQQLVGSLRARLAEGRRSSSIVAFSPDGKLLAVGGMDMQVTLYECATGKVSYVFKGHKHWVTTLAFSPDGKSIASARSGEVIIWDVQSGEVKHSRKEKDSIQAIAFSPDGKLLASAAIGGSVRLLETDSGKERATAQKVAEVGLGKHCVAFAPDGKTIAVPGNDKTIKLLDADGLAVRATLSGHGHDVVGLVFAPDGKTLASVAFDDKQIRIWDVEGAKEKRTIRYGEGWGSGLMVCLAFSPSGKTLAIGHGNGAPITLWDPETGQQHGIVGGVRGTVEFLAFSPDGNALAAVENYDKAIKIWDLEITRQKATLALKEGIVPTTVSPDGKLIVTAAWGKPIELLDAATGDKKQAIPNAEGMPAVQFAPDGKTLAIGTDMPEVVLWDLVAGKERAKLDTGSRLNKRFAFAPDGKLLAVTTMRQGPGEDGVFRTSYDIQLWDLTTNQKKGELKGHRRPVECLAFAADGKTLASGALDATARIWDVATLKERHKLDAQESRVGVVALSPDGKTLATTANWNTDLTIPLWDTETGKERHTLNGHEQIVTGLQFAPDGQSLISVSQDRTLRVWDVASGRERGTHQGHADGIRVLIPLADGKSFATFENKAVKLWDTADVLRPLNGERTDIVRLLPVIEARLPPFAAQKGELRGHKGPAHATAYALDGKLFATGGEDKTVRIWEVARGQELRKFTGHTHAVRAVAFAPKESALASAGVDRTVRLWDVGTGEQIRALTGHNSAVIALVFSPDGRLLASAAEETEKSPSEVKVWEVSTGAETRTLKRENSRFHNVLFTNDGKLLIATGLDRKASRGLVAFWDVETGQLAKTLMTKDEIYCAALSPDGKRLATGSATLDKGEMRTWDVATGKPLWQWDSPHALLLSVDYSPDGQLLAATGYGYKIWLWDAATGRERRQVWSKEGTGDRELAFSRDGKTLCVAGTYGLSVRDEYLAAVKFFDVPDLLNDAIQDTVGHILEANGKVTRQGPVYRIELRVNGRNSAAALAYVKKLGKPAALSVQFSENLTDEALAHLAGCDKLMALDFERAQDLGDAGLQHLAGLKSLEELNLSGQQGVTDAGLVHLRGLTNLRTALRRHAHYRSGIGDLARLQGFVCA
jgi:WD40 repeat protein